MTAEEYLNALRTRSRELRALRAEINALEYAASGQGAIRYDKDKVQTSASNQMEKFAIEAYEKEEAYKQKVQQYEEERFRAYEIIKKIKDKDERVLLEWYYINVSTVKKIMDELAISERKFYNIRLSAIESFGRLRDDSNRTD